MKQTAVEWLVNELKSNKKKHLGYKNIDIDFKNIIEQAKQMEKQQIIDAVKYGNSFEQGDLICEIYYKKTFKSE